MDPVQAQAGSLTQIEYPTGGWTTFEYQANDYSNVVSKIGTTISLSSQSGIGGGLRIARITDYDGNGNSYPTTYQYVKASTGLSSGILAGLKRVHYSATINGSGGSSATYDSYDLNTFDCLNYTDGKDVVYSEVKKIIPDGSYTIYTYSNSDSEFGLDESPVNTFTDGFANNIDGSGSAEASSQSFPFLSFSSRDLERGLLTSQTEYTSSGQMVHQVANTYYSYFLDPWRIYNGFVRMYDNYNITVNGGSTTVVENYFQPIKIYTYYPYLQSSTETHVDQSTGASQTTTTNYTYGMPAHRQIVESDVQNSDGNVLSTQTT